MAIHGLLGFYFLPLASFEGGLTRIGKLPESQFGWTRKQPAVDPKLIQQTSWQEADILVIGDSFSDPRVWQTALTREGLHVRTESWDSVGGICDNFSPWLREKGFKGQHVIFEIIERNVEAILARSIGCLKMKFRPDASADQPRYPPATAIDRNRADYSGRLLVGIQVRLNMLKHDLWGEQNFGIRMEHLANGCELFSHPRCNDVLFLGSGDHGLNFGDHVQDFDDSTLVAMEKINARLGGFKPMWLIVPDKSTAYLRPGKKFWDKAEQRLHAPNMLKILRQAIREKTIDLYPANDTHLSTTGYLLMGANVYQVLSGRAADYAAP